jgi:membrane protein DedA with SNARE-associated domain
MAFIGKPLRDKLRKREPLTRDERIFAIFGALSAFWTVITLALIIFTLGGYVVKFAQTLPGLIVIALLVLLVVYRWLRRRLRLMRMSRRKKAAAGA